MKLVRYLLSIAMISAVLFILYGCAGTDSNATPSGIMAKIKIAIPEKEMIDGVTYLESGNLYNGNLSEEMIAEIYNTNFDIIENYSVWITTANTVTEMGVFKLNDNADIEDFIEILNERVEKLKTAAGNMRSDEFTKAGNAVISSKGKYVYYLVTNINSILEEVILNEITAKIK